MAHIHLMHKVFASWKKHLNWAVKFKDIENKLNVNYRDWQKYMLGKSKKPWYVPSTKTSLCSLYTTSELNFT